MNMKVQCCGIALLLVILYFYNRQKKLRINAERAFAKVIWITLVSLALDMTSLIMIGCRASLSQLVVDMVCKLRNASVVWVALSGLLYISPELCDVDSTYKKKLAVWIGVAVLGTAVVCLLPMRYRYENENFLYVTGWSVTTAYILGLVFAAVTGNWLVEEKERISKRRQQAVSIWLVLWVVASLIQLLIKRELIIGYVSCIGVMILYLKLENPEVNLDRKTGMFNQNALVDYMQNFYAKGQSFAVMTILFEQALYQGSGSNMSEVAGQKLVGFVKHLRSVRVFKNNEDELVLIFKNPEEAEKEMTELYQCFEETWGKNNFMVRNTKWIYIPDSTVVKDAEEVLYLLKYAGQKCKEYGDKDFLSVDEAMVSKMHEEHRIEKLLREAVAKERVKVYYQPIYSTKEHRFISAEALVRICDENGKIVPPGMFIDIAEKNGMILKLGEIVFEKVCWFLKEYNPIQYGIEYIEVNLSVVQCAYEYLAESYINIMERYNINPSYINLEITESASLSAKKTLLDNMKVLMDYGVTFSLDDFGTGQSNLNYIVDMPVEIVKFDRQMSNAYFENGKARYVMDAAMHMIHGMQLEIVSEGIETEEQYQTMEALGISYIQGYYFSKPLPRREFLEFIRQHGSAQLEMQLS